MIFKIILFFALFKLCESYEIKICGVDENVTLKESENGVPNLIFIKSPGYPRSMTEEERKNCQFNFFKDSNDTALKFVITNGNVENINITGVTEYSVWGPYYYEVASSDASLTMKYLNISSSSSWHAFQGYVLSESMVICHSNHEPINFQSESQIIYLRPHNRNKTSFSCNWSFIGPIEYGFKFVIREAHKDLNLSVTTSSGYDVIKFVHYIFERFQNLKLRGYGIRKNQAYYNPDNFLNISVNGDEKDFEAYVTFVKNHYKIADAKCTLKDAEVGVKNVSIWTNIGDTAYPTNAQCKNELQFSKDEFVVLKIVKFEAEPFVDYIEIIDSWDKKHYINHHNPTSWPLAFSPAFFSNLNNENNTIILRFISDGSVQNEGFELHFETFECKCAPQLITVPCEGNHTYSILEQTSAYICPNTICNFNVSLNPECSSKHLILTFDRAVITEDATIGFKIFTEIETYLDSTTFTNLYHETLSIPFKPNSILSFFSLKNESHEAGMPLNFTLMASEAPKVWQNLKISKNNTSLSVDLLKMPKNSVFSVELNENMIANGETIEMFSAQFIHLLCFLLYDNKNMRKIENSLLKMLESTNKISSSSSLTIYKSLQCKDIGIPVFYRAKMAHSKYCIFSENIFNRIPANPVMTQIAKSSGACEIVLLSHKKFEITKLWTTKYGDVIVKESKSALQNYDPPFLSPFKIPPNSSIYIMTSFASTETIHFYKLPTRNLFDFQTVECVKSSYKNKNGSDTNNFNDKCNFDEYEVGFKDSLKIFDLFHKMKMSKDSDEYEILKNAGFNFAFNDTHDKWGNLLPQNLDKNGHRKMTNVFTL